MTTQQLIIRDVRLKGLKPKGNEVLEVDADTPIKWPIAWILDRAKYYNSQYVWLKILAHGYESDFSQGGYGIQFCKEDLTLSTIEQFKVLFEWLDWIDIYSCGAAFITPGCEGSQGDGNLLCSRLAQFLGSPVRASTAAQVYDSADPIDFGAWEGTVLTYGPKGDVINVEINPRI
jgi:hypothetical protein